MRKSVEGCSKVFSIADDLRLSFCGQSVGWKLSGWSAITQKPAIGACTALQVGLPAEEQSHRHLKRDHLQTTASY